MVSMIKKTGKSFYRSTFEAVLALLLVFLFLTLSSFICAPEVEASNSQSLGNLPIGAKVVDPSWEWQYKTGDNYTGSGITKPVNWIIVAKYHYGYDSGVTLLSEEVIGKRIYDNQYNHWGNSQLRSWLNNSVFYNSFSDDFKSSLILTVVPNRHWEFGTIYTTSDFIFIPSTTELGGPHPNTISTYSIGNTYPYFSEASDADRIAQLPLEFGGYNEYYWTRSPNVPRNPQGIPVPSDTVLKVVGKSGNFGTMGGLQASSAYVAIRPVLNIKPDIKVSLTPNISGVYEMISYYSMTVSSTTPSEGVLITSSTGHGGTTSYSNSITSGTSVSITAPEYHGSGAVRKRFSNWSGAITSTNQTISWTMSGNLAVTANYVDGPDPTPDPAPDPEIIYGDITGNGEIDIEDVVLSMQYVLEIKELTDEQIKAADVNGDGKVDVRDVAFIIQKVLGFIDKFPLEQ